MTLLQILAYCSIPLFPVAIAYLITSLWAARRAQQRYETLAEAWERCRRARRYLANDFHARASTIARGGELMTSQVEALAILRQACSEISDEMATCVEEF